MKQGDLEGAVRAADVLANERTYLAYVRTALAFIAFGFVIARFSLFEREFAAIAHAPAQGGSISTPFGMAMAVFGIAVGIFGAWRYAATDRALRQSRVEGLTPVAGYAIAAIVATIGILVSFSLLGVLGGH